MGFIIAFSYNYQGVCSFTPYLIPLCESTLLTDIFNGQSINYSLVIFFRLVRWEWCRICATSKWASTVARKTSTWPASSRTTPASRASTFIWPERVWSEPLKRRDRARTRISGTAEGFFVTSCKTCCLFDWKRLFWKEKTLRTFIQPLLR